MDSLGLLSIPSNILNSSVAASVEMRTLSASVTTDTNLSDTTVAETTFDDAIYAVAPLFSWANGASSNCIFTIPDSLEMVIISGTTTIKTQIASASDEGQIATFYLKSTGNNLYITGAKKPGTSNYGGVKVIFTALVFH